MPQQACDVNGGVLANGRNKAASLIGQPRQAQVLVFARWRRRWALKASQKGGRGVTAFAAAAKKPDLFRHPTHLSPESEVSCSVFLPLGEWPKSGKGQENVRPEINNQSTALVDLGVLKNSFVTCFLFRRMRDAWS